VIAIHLQISKTAAKEIQSAFSVLERSVSLVIAETEIRGMAGADLIVRVNLEDYTTTDYEKADALVQRGYDAAAAPPSAHLNLCASRALAPKTTSTSRIFSACSSANPSARRCSMSISRA